MTFQIEKQKLVLDYIKKHGKATVAELSALFSLSNVTIRKYLNEFHEKGLVIKTHGGAISKDNNMNYEIPYSSKNHLFMNEKKRIGKAAAEMINEREAVIIDAGSTAYELARCIGNKTITVITDDIKIAAELAGKVNINLIITGGKVQKNVYTAFSPETKDFLSKVHVSKVFLGADAIDIKAGVTNRTLEEAAVKTAMVAAADRVVLMADHSKFDSKAFVHVCSLEDIDTVISDGIPKDFAHIFNRLGTKVMLV